MKNFLSLLFTTALFAGCSTIVNNDYVNPLVNLDWEGYQKVYLPYSKARQIRYFPEKKDEDYWQTPEETERLKTGDCEDFAIYLNHLWKKEGLQGKLVLGIPRRRSDKRHAWNEINWKNETYLADAASGVFIRKKDKSTNYYIEIDMSPYYSKLVSEALRESKINFSTIDYMDVEGPLR